MSRSGAWIKPQLCKLVTIAPTGPQWVHEIKFNGYRMAARIEKDKAQRLARSGLNWTVKYSATAVAFAKRKFTTAYIDGELYGVRPDAVTSFELMPASIRWPRWSAGRFRVRSVRA